MQRERKNHGPEHGGKNYQATFSFGEFDEVNHWIRARLVLGKRRDNARKSKKKNSWFLLDDDKPLIAKR